MVKSKGNERLKVDDLRQDSVLSSVFNMVNILLAKSNYIVTADFETRARELSIRTYKIVPLAPQAGVIHWLEGTRPLGDLLAHAHATFLQLTKATSCRLEHPEMPKGNAN
jgi:phosphatidylinositol kinase/protein kinase (PI-3  family)